MWNFKKDIFRIAGDTACITGDSIGYSFAIAVCTNAPITLNTVATGSFNANYTGVAIAPNGDAYTTDTVSVGSGNIYERLNGGTTFNYLPTTSWSYSGIAATPSGDIYAIVYFGGIFKRTGGLGSWVSIGQDTNYWSGICSATNGDMYACESNTGRVYKKLAGETKFNNIIYTHSSTNLRDITISPIGDIYICTSNDIWKQTGGVGSFVALGTTNQSWTGLSAAPNGNIFACSEDTPSTDGDIFVQYGGSGSFVSLNQANRDWSAIAFKDNIAFATVAGGDVYKITF